MRIQGKQQTPLLTAVRSKINSVIFCYPEGPGKELLGKGVGFHLYLFPQNATDVPRFLAALGKRLVLAGYDRVAISLASLLLERTLAYLLVDSLEWLDFVT